MHFLRTDCLGNFILFLKNVGHTYGQSRGHSTRGLSEDQLEARAREFERLMNVMHKDPTQRRASKMRSTVHEVRNQTIFPLSSKKTTKSDHGITREESASFSQDDSDRHAGTLLSASMAQFCVLCLIFDKNHVEARYPTILLLSPDRSQQ